jgi:hypothetical protein
VVPVPVPVPVVPAVGVVVGGGVRGTTGCGSGNKPDDGVVS